MIAALEIASLRKKHKELDQIISDKLKKVTQNEGKELTSEEEKQLVKEERIEYQRLLTVLSDKTVSYSKEYEIDINSAEQAIEEAKKITNNQVLKGNYGTIVSFITDKGNLGDYLEFLKTDENFYRRYIEKKVNDFLKKNNLENFKNLFGDEDINEFKVMEINKIINAMFHSPNLKDILHYLIREKKCDIEKFMWDDELVISNYAQIPLIQLQVLSVFKYFIRIIYRKYDEERQNHHHSENFFLRTKDKGDPKEFVKPVLNFFGYLLYDCIWHLENDTDKSKILNQYKNAVLSQSLLFLNLSGDLIARSHKMETSPHFPENISSKEAKGYLPKITEIINVLAYADKCVKSQFPQEKELHFPPNVKRVGAPDVGDYITVCNFFDKILGIPKQEWTSEIINREMERIQDIAEKNRYFEKNCPVNADDKIEILQKQEEKFGEILVEALTCLVTGKEKGVISLKELSKASIRNNVTDVANVFALPLPEELTLFLISNRFCSLSPYLQEQIMKKKKSATDESVPSGSINVIDIQGDAAHQHVRYTK
ncbi:MAG: hypothetical protein HRK26_03035 [Rickettsiaceae bacterium H1]|nr:hypothetical protein [Rickettsiaceae bacterium H1]